MKREEAIEILSDIRAEYNIFASQKEADRYRAISIAINDMRKRVYKRLPPLKPCVCGRKRIDLWLSTDKTYFYMCPNCGRKAWSDETVRGARECWNNYISDQAIEESNKNGMV